MMTMTLISGQNHIDSFLKYLPTQNNTSHAVLTSSSSDSIARITDIEQLVYKMQRHSLWTGKWQGSSSTLGNNLSTLVAYPSQSEADYAILNDIAKEAVFQGIASELLQDSVMKTFMQSGMYRSEKHNALLNHSVPKAVANALEGIVTNKAVEEIVKLPRLNSTDGIINFSNTPPTARIYVLQDLIVAVKVCVLAGLGGVSKTMLSMQWAVCIALGLPYMGKDTLAGAVMLILGEEDTEEIARRFNAIAKIMCLSSKQVALIKNRIRAFPMNGLDSRLTMKIAGSLEGTEFTAEVIAASKALEIEAGVPVRLIILDHAGLIHGGEFNSREDVVQTMRQVNFIAQQCNAAALVLAHSPKTAVGKDKADSNDVAGSAAWVDLARAVFVLRNMDVAEGKMFDIDADMRKNYASLSVVKNNYGPSGDLFWLERLTVKDYGVSVLQHVDLVKSATPIKGGAILQSLIIKKIEERVSLYSKTGFRDKFHGKTGPLKASKSEIDRALDELLSRSELILREPIEAERKQFDLHHTTKQVLDFKA
ncbi:AAA domain containing protein [Methylophilaceae bacterium]